MYKTINNKGSPLDNLIIKEEIDNSNNLAIMIEQSDGTYVESKSTKWPTEMKYNEDLSGCIDNNGNKLSGILSFDNTNKVVTVTVSKTSYCYLYFDIKNNIGQTILKMNPKTLSDDLVGGLYRYQGKYDVVEDNYICFGTSDIDLCKSNPEMYMYRIIGITKNGQLKLIRKESLSIAMEWSNSNGTLNWVDTILYKNLNGYTFLNNDGYIENEWKDIVSTETWKYGSTRLLSEIYDSNKAYEIENNFENSVFSKIGLMYIHDYLYAFGETSPTDYTEAVNSWIHLSHNDTVDAYYENLMVSAYNSENYTHSYFISQDGKVQIASGMNKRHNRPVFYLIEDIYLLKGEGVENNPYVIDFGDVVLKTDSTGEQILNIDSTNVNFYGNLYRYHGMSNDIINNYICFGTANVDTCINNTDKYMYRIIGITKGGSIKVVKSTVMSSTQWSASGQQEHYKWSESDIFENINAELFLEDSIYIPSGWEEKIETVNWNYNDGYNNGTITLNVEGISAYRFERSFDTDNLAQTRVLAKIGLLQISDYYLAYDNSCVGTKCKDSWLNSILTTLPEWTMNLEDSLYTRPIWLSKSNMGISYGNESYYFRPVFYISSNLKISGQGTESNPYIITN